MKVLVISDTHRQIEAAERLIGRLKPQIDMVIHLGDHIKDARDLSYVHEGLRFEWVPGNCDYSKEPLDKVININGKRFLMTHGHNYGVKLNLRKLINKVEKLKLDGAMYGHTHVAFSDRINGKEILNPGSISQPRTSKGPTYGILEVKDNGKITTKIKKITIF